MCKLLNIYGNDFEQTEIHTAEQLEIELYISEIKTVIENEQRGKSPNIDEISAEIIGAGNRRVGSKITQILSILGRRNNGFNDGESHFTH
jgi:hypothetical protein